MNVYFILVTTLIWFIKRCYEKEDIDAERYSKSFSKR